MRNSCSIKHRSLWGRLGALALLALISLAACGPKGKGGGGDSIAEVETTPEADSGVGGGGGETDGGSGDDGGTLGAEVCGNGLDDNSNGLTDCADPACAAQPACSGTCQDLCLDGTYLCDSGGVRSCAVAANGCLAFSPPQACPQGAVCSGGACGTACLDICNDGDKLCSASSVIECQRLPSGCTDWVNPVACATSEVCSAGQCVAKGSCTSQCTQGQSRCTAGGQKQSCLVTSSGCAEWSLPVSCQSGQTCVLGNSQCTALQACTLGQKRCSPTGLSVQTCNSSGSWQQAESCNQACQSGACSDVAQCTPAALRCNGKAVEICNSSGSAWLHSATCTVSCAGGLCTGGCTPQERRCNGKVVEECGAGGISWNAVETCSTLCDLSTTTCALASLDVTALNTPLEGVVVVEGPVLVRTGASLVSQTGNLTLTAHSITVEEGGSITAIPSGLGPLGAAHAPSSNSPPYYGGGGGGYGTSGTNGYYGGLGGSAFGYATNAVVFMGGPGADNFLNDPAGGLGGKGGGVLRLVAESISIRGQVNANGENGGPSNGGYNGGGGGGAGGGIQLAANALDIAGTGSVSAAPGLGGAGWGSTHGGNGGDGRVKLLTGQSRTVDGGVTGVETYGILPPLVITSSTHPNQARVYNDGFSSVALSWNRPFASRQGYYHRVDTNEQTVPTPASAQFTPSESATFPASTFSSGKKFFHIVSVDANSNVGAVQNAFSVQVNSTVPSVKSTSHPTSGTWVDNPNVFFQWTFPMADEHLKGAYYVLDRYGSTVPTVTDTFIPLTQKQLLMSALAPGIWVFHLVSIDTQGYLTRKAAHFVVRVGPDPGTGGIVGRVNGPNAQALSYADVTINRGIASTTATSNGTYNLGLVSAGSWEVTASADGYHPATQTISVTAGSTATADFTLTPE